MAPSNNLGKVVLKDGEIIQLQMLTYPNDRVGIVGMCEDGERYDVLSRNIPDFELDKGEFFVPVDEEQESWTEICRHSGIFKIIGKNTHYNGEIFEVWKIVGIS